MARTGAERQRDYLARRAERLALLERENGELRRLLTDAQSDLANAAAECERLAATQCRHPAPMVDGGTCHACGSDDVW
jgi:hypothetical protein